MRALARFGRRQGPALVALFVALCGTSYATGFPANVVGSKQLKRNAVTRPKLASAAVNGAKVASNSVSGAKVIEARLGKVRSAARADTASNVAIAADATSATNAAKAASATSADDSSRLGGRGGTEYASRVTTGFCRNGFSSLGPDECNFGVFAVSENLSLGTSIIAGGNVTFEIACHAPTKTELRIRTTPSSGPWSLAWFYGDGASASADSISLVGGSTQVFPFGGKRIEGQFILSQGNTVTTYKVHLLDLGTSCEFQETVSGAE